MQGHGAAGRQLSWQTSLPTARPTAVWQSTPCAGLQQVQVGGWGYHAEPQPWTGCAALPIRPPRCHNVISNCAQLCHAAQPTRRLGIKCLAGCLGHLLRLQCGWTLTISIGGAGTYGKRMATRMWQAATRPQAVNELDVPRSHLPALHKQCSRRLACQQIDGQAGLQALQQALAPGW